MILNMVNDANNPKDSDQDCYVDKSSFLIQRLIINPCLEVIKVNNIPGCLGKERKLSLSCSDSISISMRANNTFIIVLLILFLSHGIIILLCYKHIQKKKEV